MATVFDTMDGATLKVADSEANLVTAPVAASCQIVSAVLEPQQNTVSLAATFCSPAGTRGLASGLTLEVTAYSDWKDPDGFCWWSVDNDGETMWFELTIPDGGDMTGEIDVHRAGYGGGADAPPQVTLSFPARNVTGTPPT